jgi:glutaredoxin
MNSQISFFVVGGCPLCENVRQWLDSNEIDYEELDVSADFGAFRKMHRLTRQRLVPVVSRGDSALVRPSVSQLEELLKS